MIGLILSVITVVTLSDSDLSSFFAAHISEKSGMDELTAHFYGSKIEEKSIENGIDPFLVFAINSVESNFKPEAKSKTGARGVMQIVKKTERWVLDNTRCCEVHLGWDEPTSNVDVGVSYLSYLMEKYRGDVRLALIAYNSGPGVVDRYLKKRIKFVGNRLSYFKTVDKNMRLYKTLYYNWRRDEKHT